MVTDDDVLRERIELEQAEHKFCTYCGEPMDIVVRDGVVIAQCWTLRRSASRLRALARSLHDQRRLFRAA